MTQPRSMFDTVKKYFGDSPWVTTQFSGQPILRFNHESASGSWVCIAHCRESEDRFVFYSIGIAATPEARRKDVAEFLTRANFGLLIGNFEMDLDDGEIRFKTSIDVEGDRLSATLLDHLVKINVQMMEKYLPGIVSVIEEGASPLDAITKVEGPSSPRTISE